MKMAYTVYIYCTILLLFLFILLQLLDIEQEIMILSLKESELQFKVAASNQKLSQSQSAIHSLRLDVGKWESSLETNASKFVTLNSNVTSVNDKIYVNDTKRCLTPT